MKEGQKMSKVSIVLPSYNEEGMIPKATQVIGNLMDEANIAYELIFVDDGSKDQTWKEILQVMNNNPNITGVRFSRNFGKESAIMAGLETSSGDCCVVMDCDLQHPPEKIIEMYHLWEKGYQVVEGIKRTRGKERLFQKCGAGLFYKILTKSVGIDMSRASDFKLMDRNVVNVLLSMKEKNAFFRALSSWVGFEKTTVEFDVQERTIGESKWSFWSLVKYAITNIVSFSAAPMQFVTFVGVFSFVFTMIMGVQTLINFISGKAIEGFTTVILLLLFFGSMIMISMGIIGYYISKIYEEVKGRPRYIISDIAKEQKRSK